MYKMVQFVENQNIFFVVRDINVIHSSHYHEMTVLRDYINEMAAWCKEAFDNEYETWNIESSGSTFTFEKDVDAMAFKMRWV